MVCGTVVCLTSYSTVVTIVLVIVSCLYHNSGTNSTCSTGTTDCSQEIQNHLSMVDVSSNTIGQVGEPCKCNTLEYLGFEIFELIMLAITLIGIAYMGIVYIGKGKICFTKWKESRRIAKEKKMRAKFVKYEASTSKRGPTNKVKSEPKREPKQEPKKEERITYEKGEEYVEPEFEYESDFEEA